MMIFNQSVDKKSAQNPFKPVFNSYKILLDFLYTFSLKMSINFAIYKNFCNFLHLDSCKTIDYMI